MDGSVKFNIYHSLHFLCLFPSLCLNLPLPGGDTPILPYPNLTAFQIPNSELNPISKLPVTLATCWEVIKISHPICSQRHIYLPGFWLVFHTLCLGVQRAWMLAPLFPVSLTLIPSIEPRRDSGTSHTEGRGEWSVAFPLVGRAELSYLSTL